MSSMIEEIELEERVAHYVKTFPEAYKRMVEENHHREKRERNLFLSKSGKNAAYQGRYREKFYKVRSVKKLSEEEKEAILLFYKNRPEGMHVDHIIPLTRGGKHCLSNLQYLPAKENLRKKNLLEDELRQRENWIAKLKSSGVCEETY